MADQRTSEVISRSEFLLAVDIPNDIREHANVYFDEKLYVEVLTLLSDIVTSSASELKDRSTPALIPSSEQVAIISSLLVHPDCTRGDSSSSDRSVPALALSILRELLNRCGPLNANFKGAFTFQQGNLRIGRLEIDYREIPVPGSRSPKARALVAQQGLWKSARDFWHIVGWAFNCSVCDPKRWKCWKVCLDFLLDVLEMDWRESERVDAHDHISQKAKDPGAAMDHNMLQKSLLVLYLVKCTNVAGEVKRVVKAIFADGSDENLRLFPEVFLNETASKDPRGINKRKRRAFDEMPYAEHDSDGPAESPSPSNSAALLQASSTDEPLLLSYGDSEALRLRQRILALLSRVACCLPNLFADPSTLYELCWDHIRPMPVALFAKNISPSQSNEISVSALIRISTLGCSRLLSHQANSRRGIINIHDDSVSQETLERCYLPHAACTSSAEDNAKLAILIENIFRHILKTCEYSSNLENAVRKGIQSRERRVKTPKRRKEGTDQWLDEDALTWMNFAGQRLISMSKWLKSQQGNK